MSAPADVPATGSSVLRSLLSNRFGIQWVSVLIITISLYASCLTCCSDPQPEVFSILNKARTESGEPLPGLRILENGESRGQTDEAGVLFLQVRGFVGKRITLSAVCPEGYEPSIRDRIIALQHLSGLDNERIVSGPEVSWQCSSRMRTAALVIRASAQPNLPVAIRGQHIGRTTADGVAHFLLKEPVGSRLSVKLDTSDYPDLRPQNPKRLLRIEKQNAILIFDQQFTRVSKKKKRRRSKPAPKRHIPYKITD